MELKNYQAIDNEVKSKGARLVAISKTQPVESIEELHKAGQRVFGENKVQELIQKYEALPKDIEWHIVGHLQTNKVKYIAPFIALIHSVDSLKLLAEVNKQALANGRVIDCLLQVFIAQEETKFGLSIEELYALLQSAEYAQLKNVRIRGLMGMATNTIDETKVDAEFTFIKNLFDHVKQKYFADAAEFNELSIGMTSDYKLALKHGATLVRVGSAIFGTRRRK